MRVRFQWHHNERLLLFQIKTFSIILQWLNYFFTAVRLIRTCLELGKFKILWWQQLAPQTDFSFLTRLFFWFFRQKKGSSCHLINKVFDATPRLKKAAILPSQTKVFLMEVVRGWVLAQCPCPFSVHTLYFHSFCFLCSLLDPHYSKLGSLREQTVYYPKMELKTT